MRRFRLAWRAGQELVIHIAPVTHLAHVVRSTSERLRADHLNPMLLVAVISLLDVSLGHQLFTATAEPAPTNRAHMEEPKPARRHLVAPKALLSLEFVLDILHTSRCAVVLMVHTMIVPGVLRKSGSPAPCICLNGSLGSLRPVRRQSRKHLAILGDTKHVQVAALTSSNAVAALRSNGVIETVSPAIWWTCSLQGTGERQVSVSIGTHPWLSILCTRKSLLSRNVGLLHRGRQRHIAAHGTIFFLSTSHAALPLLTRRERLWRQLHAKLSPRLPC